MSIIHKSIHFASPDPLGDGVGDDIEAERNEPDAFNFDQPMDGNQLADSWSHTLEDLKQDPDWFDLASSD